MATYHSSIVLKPEQADLIMHYLNDEPTQKSEALFSDNSMCFTAHFPGNYVMEVWCSGIGDWADWCTNKAYGEAFLFDEFENKIETYLASGVVSAIEAAPATSTTSAVGVPAIESDVITLDIVAQALALLTDTVENGCVVMNRGTYAAFRAAALNANYSVDPFEGLTVVFSSALPSLADASAGDTWLIVGDMSAVTVNFPNGDQVKFIYDPYTNAPADLVRITGRLYAGFGVTTPGKLAKVSKEK